MREDSDATAAQFEGLAVDVLCDRLVAEHHGEIYGTVPRIRARLAAIAQREPDAATRALRQAFTAAADLLLTHLSKEENILFPALAALAEAERSGGPRPSLAFPTVLHPIRVLEAEHRRLLSAFDELRRLAHEHPEAGTDAWRPVLADLTSLSDALTAHDRLASDVLFPRALDLDRRV